MVWRPKPHQNMDSREPGLRARKPGLRARIVVRIDRDGEARTSGTARIQDGTSNTILVAEERPTEASCADVDGDGTGGLTRLTFVLRDIRSGEQSTATVVPDGGEADEVGRHPAPIVLAGPRSITAAGTLRIKGRFD
jgi:hypothetical protein